MGQTMFSDIKIDYKSWVLMGPSIVPLLNRGLFIVTKIVVHLANSS